MEGDGLCWVVMGFCGGRVEGGELGWKGFACLPVDGAHPPTFTVKLRLSSPLPGPRPGGELCRGPKRARSSQRYQRPNGRGGHRLKPQEDYESTKDNQPRSHQECGRGWGTG